MKPNYQSFICYVLVTYLKMFSLLQGQTFFNLHMNSQIVQLLFKRFLMFCVTIKPWQTSVDRTACGILWAQDGRALTRTNLTVLSVALG